MESKCKPKNHFLWFIWCTFQFFWLMIWFRQTACAKSREKQGILLVPDRKRWIILFSLSMPGNIEQNNQTVLPIYDFWFIIHCIYFISVTHRLNEKKSLIKKKIILHLTNLTRNFPFCENSSKHWKFMKFCFTPLLLIFLFFDMILKSWSRHTPKGSKNMLKFHENV